MCNRLISDDDYSLFQTDLTFLNNRIGEMKRRCSVQEKAE